MTAYEIIIKKKHNIELTTDEINWFVSGYTKGSIPDYQMSAFLMAICFCPLSDRETADMTMAMANSGDMLDLKLDGFCVDKHSTGGVGDKTTFITAPIAASCGVYVPKMSGRGLGHTGGTIDKLESIPGLCTSLDYDKFLSVVKEAGFAIAGQTGSLVPADKKIYSLRSCTGTVDSIPLICSSVMSKKLATSADGIVLDVKVGDGAFMKTVSEAEQLADAMVRVGVLAGKKCTAILTDMDKPLGRSVGNALEVIEAVETLKGKGSSDLTEVSLVLAAEMLHLSGKGTPEECMTLATDALYSGSALKTFGKMISLQGGDPRFIDDYSLLPTAKIICEVISSSDGVISGISCEKTGLVSLALGAGRITKDLSIDPSAGIIFNKIVGEKVEKGECLAVLHTSTDCDIKKLADDFKNVFNIGEENKKVHKNNIIKIIRGY